MNYLVLKESQNINGDENWSSKYSRETLDRVIRTFQPMSKVPISYGDAEIMLTNLTRYFEILKGWDETYQEKLDAETQKTIELSSPPQMSEHPQGEN